MPTCGGLFDGGGLLALGLHLAGWEHRWLCEVDEFRRGLLAKRFPGVPVFDDVRAVRGEAAADADGLERPQEHAGDDSLDGERSTKRRRAVLTAGVGGLATADSGRLPRAHAATGPASPGHASPVDLIAGGFPCRGTSSAGKKGGFENAETVLWHEMRRVIGEVGPRFVVIENVRDALSVAAGPGQPPGSLWGVVLADLAALGFDVVWDVLPAAAIGAPHLRQRIFAVASLADRVARTPDSPREWGSGPVDEPGAVQRVERSDRAYRDAADADEAGRVKRCGPVAGGAQHPAAERDGADAANATREGGQGARPGRQALGRTAASRGVAVDWGDYLPAIQRWEAVHGPAPEPLVRRMDDGDPGVRRMRARLDRQRLSALGDGVHVHVARLVGEYVMGLAT